jgi:hypothetical protein
MSDKAQGGAASQMGLCPVCKQGPVTVQASHDDGRQQGYCKQHDSFLPLVSMNEGGLSSMKERAVSSGG